MYIETKTIREQVLTEAYYIKKRFYKKGEAFAGVYIRLFCYFRKNDQNNIF